MFKGILRIMSFKNVTTIKNVHIYDYYYLVK